jgi:hypothetical protein
MNWMNVSTTGFGGGFRKKQQQRHDARDRRAARAGTGRCLLFDGAHPRRPGAACSSSSRAPRASRPLQKNFVDVQGWMDGDDVAGQFQLCELGQQQLCVRRDERDALPARKRRPDPGLEALLAEATPGDWGGRA